MEDYQRQFLALLCRADPLSPMQQVQLFTAGLLKPLRTDVELQHPTNLRTAMSPARAYEVRTQEESADLKQPVRHKQSAPSAPVPAPSARPSLGPPQPTVLAPPGLRSAPLRCKFRHLSTEEMADRRAKGLCYSCPEKFHRNHTCSMKGIYMLELDDDNAADEPSEQAKISLHALTGIQASRTMQLQVNIAGHTVLALVDSGSTHNFIAKGTAHRLGVACADRNRLSVVVANGDRIKCAGHCDGVTLSIDAEDFCIDFFTIPLEAFELILESTGCKR